MDYRNYGAKTGNLFDEKDFWNEFSIAWGQAMNIASENSHYWNLDISITKEEKRKMVVEEAREILKDLLRGKLDKSNLDIFQKYYDLKHNKKVEE